MFQEKINELNDLEQKFLILTQNGNPNVVDNGFFTDAVFNVTAMLKRKAADMTVFDQEFAKECESNIRVIQELYQSLKAFETLYTHSLNVVL